MYPIEIPDFASQTTRERCEAHNSAVAELEDSQASAAREAADLAAADVMTANVEELDTRARKLRQRKWANVKKQIALYQARLPVCEALLADRREAHQSAVEVLERARAEVLTGLRAVGLSAWLGCVDPIVRMQAAQLVDCAAGPDAALHRLAEIRDWSTNLSEVTNEARREIARLTETLKADVREAVGA